MTNLGRAERTAVFIVRILQNLLIR